MKTRIDFILYEPGMKIEPASGRNVVYSTNKLDTVPHVGDYVQSTFMSDTAYEIVHRMFNNNGSVVCYVREVDRL